MTAKKKKPADETALTQAVLEAALKHAAFDGFTDKTLARAGEDAGADEETLARLFPDGALSLITLFSDTADKAMEAKLATLDLAAMKVRERIRVAVKTRIDALKPHKEAARRAAAFLSLPTNAALAATLLYATVDAIWRAAGDTSTDFNFYTKRAILAGVYSTTLFRWFTDQSLGESDTDAFLAARIQNVMQFEKFKAQVKDVFARMPSPFGTAAPHN